MPQALNPIKQASLEFASLVLQGFIPAAQADKQLAYSACSELLHLAAADPLSAMEEKATPRHIAAAVNFKSHIIFNLLLLCYFLT
jgi:hypothetical protein